MKITIILAAIGLAVSQSVWAAALQDNGDGTVTDLVTALVWQQQDDNVTRTHATAVSYCLGLSLAGKSDWRLPTVKELTSIVDYRARSPSIDTAAFPSTNSSDYWSASGVASVVSNAWFVNFNSGNVGSGIKTIFNFYVRCVR